MIKKINKILFLLTIILFVCCTNRPQNVLNIDKMSDVLTEMHKADGMLATLRMQGKAGSDSLQQSMYAAVLQDFKITQSDFDSSLVWYAKNPKRFEAVYVQVDRNLNKWQKQVESGKFGKDSVAEATVMLWQKNELLIAEDSANYDSLNFEIKNTLLVPHDTYTLHFLQKIEKDTAANQPKTVLKINYADGKNDSVIMPSYADGLSRRFNIRLKANKMERITSINAIMFQTDSTNHKLRVVFDSVQLKRTYNILAQDSLQRKVNQLPQQSVHNEPPQIFQRKIQKN
ncbi:MAG: DUF4296 domain-containing protein [Prevotellaceae bacterium]|jgi:hypothetical protein|nr:DUF4296 domain-containing protein [Prevotellaceae bacterium]